MKQGVAIALIVGFVVVGLGVGFLLAQGLGSGGRVSGLDAATEQRIKDLEEAVDYMAEQFVNMQVSGGSFRIAYVDMFRVLETLYSLDNEVVKKALEEFETEKARIEAEQTLVLKQFSDGEITLKQRDDKLLELETALQRRNLELSAPIQSEILKAVKEIGKAQGYALILDNPASKLSPIVLDNRVGLADDITQTVIDKLKESLKAQQQE